MATPHPSKAGVRTTPLPSGESVPVLGQGTWDMGEHATGAPTSRRAAARASTSA